MLDNPDQYARLFYLVLLGCFIASYFLFNARQKMSQTLQQAAIWGMIFVFVIIGYGFKDVVRSQIFPSDPISIGQGRIALTRSSDGHFYANLRINDQPIEFVVDTGATLVVLSPDDADKAGFNTDELRFLGRALTANGEISTADVRLDRVELGDYTDRNVPAAVNGSPMKGSLLGMSYLQNYRIEIDGDTMILSR